MNNIGQFMNIHHVLSLSLLLSYCMWCCCGKWVKFSYRVTNINLYATSCTINRSFAATSQLFFFGCFFLFRVNVPIWKRWTGGTRRGRRAVLWDQRHKTTYSYKHTNNQHTKANVEEGMALYSRCYKLVINNCVPVFPAAESNCRRRLMWRYCTAGFVWIRCNCLMVQYP